VGAARTSEHCGLTPRSRRGPTALHLARRPPWFIMRPAGQAQRRRSRLTSNVRPHMRKAVLLVGLVAVPVASQACSCLPPDLYLSKDDWARSAIKASDHVVHARVVKVNAANVATVQILESLKTSTPLESIHGNPGPGASCGIRFTAGEDHIYLVEGGQVGLCSRLPATPAMLKALRELTR
jgi:hypothetical protein